MRMFWTMSDRDPIDRQYTDALKLGSSWKGTQSFHPRGGKFKPNTDYYKRWDVTMDNVIKRTKYNLIKYCITDKIMCNCIFFVSLNILVTRKRRR